MRLDKFLSDCGIGTRSQVKQLIKKGSIMINGEICRNSDIKIDEINDAVSYEGKVLNYSKYHYYMLYKPAGVITATTDRISSTVMDLLTGINHKNLAPVGRLDKDTEGLLIITDDGMLAHNLLSPVRHVPKTYLADIDGIVTENHIKLFAEGLDIGDDKPTKPAILDILMINEAEHSSSIKITITEGRYHQIKRMFQAVNMEVTYLKRLTMGSLTLDKKLAPGSFRELTSEEIKALKN